MKCELIFYYEKKLDKNELIQYLKNKSNYRIITNNSYLNKFLETKNKESYVLEDIIPSKSDKGKKAFEESRELLLKYKKIFSKIQFKNIKIFETFDYPLLRQLLLLEKIRIILEDKKDTVFIFEGYFEIYNTILELAIKIGYESNLNINSIENGKISNFTKMKKNRTKNWFSIIRFKNFFGNSFKESKKMKFKILLIILNQFISLKFKQFLSNNSLGEENRTLDELTKKFEIKINKNIHKYGFFITGSREDLFFKNIKSILNEFKDEKQFEIYTSDITTSLILSKQKISFINLFEDVNIISNQIFKTNEGKKINTDIKKIIFDNSTLLGINTLSEYFYRQIDRSIAIILLCDKIFKKNKFKTIFPVADGEMFENISISIAKNHLIPSVTLLPGAFNPLPIFEEWFHSDKICVSGNKDQELMTQIGYKKEKIIVTGNPKLDSFCKLEQQDSKIKLEKKYKIDSSKKILLIARSLWEENDEKWISKLIKECTKDKIQVIIKIHPIYKTKSNEISQKKIDEIKRLCSNVDFLITYDEDLYLLLSASDLVIIHESSTVGIEACIANKPIIITDFLKNFIDFEIRFHKIGAALYTDTYENLVEKIKDVLLHKKYEEDLERGREEIINMYNYKNDGKASNRVFEIITNKKLSD
jgi:hypothetical protein